MRQSTTLLVLFLLLQFPAFSQRPVKKISLSVKNERLEKVLKEIMRQTGYTVFYNENIPAKMNEVKVTLTVKEADLTTVLDHCFKDQSLSYRLIGEVIIIQERKDAESGPAKQTPGAQQPVLTAVSGIVVNERNVGIDNVTVIVKRTGKGVITTEKGEFYLDNIRLNDTLTVSCIGYNTREIAAFSQDRRPLLISLAQATNTLDEVVMTAFGKTSRRLATGNITKISAEELERQPVMNPLLALQGRVPGMVVTPTTGYVSSPVSVQIRGLNSLNKGAPSDPLYIIDGVPINVLSLNAGSGRRERVSPGYEQSPNNPNSSTTGGQSPLFNINPLDIESIEILKDADATAVYGARGGNGIVLITTKKGKPGATRFELQVTPAFFTMGRNARYYDVLNTQQYLAMRREAFKNDGITPTLATAPDLLYWDTTAYTDWQRKLMGGIAKTTDITAGVSGGNDQTNFRISANYTRTTNTTDLSGATQRVTVASNISHATLNRKFSVSLSTNFAYSNINVVRGIFNAYAPNGPGIYDENGALNWAKWTVNGLLPDVTVYPFGIYKSLPNPESGTVLFSSLALNYKIFNGLDFKLVTGYNFSNNNTRNFINIAQQSPYSNPSGRNFFSNTNISSLTVYPQLDYRAQIGRSLLSVKLVGQEVIRNANSTALIGTGYTSDALIQSINGATITVPAMQTAKSKDASFVVNVNYDWEGKYILNLVGTRQGSSKFGPGKKYGDFGSAGMAWIASEEKWLRKVLPDIISLVKFRGSYGIKGSDAISDYQYMALWQIQTAANNYNGETTLTPSVRPNQRYGWESQTNLEGAVNIGFLNNRFTVEIALYRNRVSNQLTSVPTPGYINAPGITGIVENIPLVLQNSGWESIVTAQIVKRKNFDLSAGFNISQNKNILQSFPGIESTPYFSQYKVGQSIDVVYLYHYLGVNPLTGEYEFADYNGDWKVSGYTTPVPTTGDDDRYVIVNRQPKFFGGMNIDGRYRQLNFGLGFSYKKQMGQNIYAGKVFSNGTFNINIPTEFYNNHWQKPGDIADNPSFSTKRNIGNFRNSDLVYSDASYIRLNNVYLSHPFPQSWVKYAGLKGAMLACEALNVLLLTKYNGLDPDVQGLSALPPAAIYRLKLTCQFK